MIQYYLKDGMTVPSEYDVTLALFSGPYGPRGMVCSPLRATNVPIGRTRYGPLDALDAVRSAFSLASTYGCDVAIVDPDGCWRPGWGEVPPLETHPVAASRRKKAMSARCN